IWGGGIASMVLMLILGVPLYTCAASSTPMAAALALKGLSPGAALVFLLAGPAANISGLVVLLKVLGRRAVGVYLATVVALTLAAGFALNAIYHVWGLDLRDGAGVRSEPHQECRRARPYRRAHPQHMAHPGAERMDLAPEQNSPADRQFPHPAKPD